MQLKPPFPYSVTGAMENWGLVTYRYGEFFLGKNNANLFSKDLICIFLISIFISVENRSQQAIKVNWYALRGDHVDQ